MAVASGRRGSAGVVGYRDGSAPHSEDMAAAVFSEARRGAAGPAVRLASRTASLLVTPRSRRCCAWRPLLRHTAQAAIGDTSILAPGAPTARPNASCAVSAARTAVRAGGHDPSSPITSGPAVTCAVWRHTTRRRPQEACPARPEGFPVRDGSRPEQLRLTRSFLHLRPGRTDGRCRGCPRSRGRSSPPTEASRAGHGTRFVISVNPRPWVTHAQGALYGA